MLIIEQGTEESLESFAKRFKDITNVEFEEWKSKSQFITPLVSQIERHEWMDDNYYLIHACYYPFWQLYKIEQE